MSRTHRCKKYLEENATSWDRVWRRQLGPYAKREYVRVGERGLYAYIWREPTPREKWLKKRAWFGESSSANTRSPNNDYRNFRQRENRRMTQHELHKFMKYEDYEPMIEAEPRNCWWDWS